MYRYIGTFLSWVANCVSRSGASSRQKYTDIKCQITFEMSHKDNLVPHTGKGQDGGHHQNLQ